MLGACKSKCLHNLVFIMLWIRTHWSLLPNYFRIDLNVGHSETMGHTDGNAGSIKLILFGQARLGVSLEGSENTYCTLSAS